jgi:hypothetical protein
MASISEIRWVGSMAGAVVRTTIWSLPFATGCPSDGGEDEDGVDDDSTSADDGNETPMTADDDADDGGTTLGDDGDDDGGSTTLGDDDADTTTLDGADDTTTADDGNDTLLDGCWDRDFFDDDYYAADGEPTWEPFTCAVPMPCEPLNVYFQATDEMTPEEVAAADASARCMLEALRDGTEADHSITSIEIDGQYEYRLHYVVLPDGVVGSMDWVEDLSAGKQETYRQTRDAAFFDTCLAETELEPLVSCLVGTLEQGGGFFPALDLDLCIDAEPICPE